MIAPAQSGVSRPSCWAAVFFVAMHTEQKGWENGEVSDLEDVHLWAVGQPGRCVRKPSGPPPMRPARGVFSRTGKPRWAPVPCPGRATGRQHRAWHTRGGWGRRRVVAGGGAPMEDSREGRGHQKNSTATALAVAPPAASPSLDRRRPPPLAPASPATRGQRRASQSHRDVPRRPRRPPHHSAPWRRPGGPGGADRNDSS